MKKANKLILLGALGKDVKLHPELLNEIRELIFNTGHENEFFRLLVRRIEQAKQVKQDVTYLEGFEKLSEAPGLYSMHLHTKNFNIRILYSYIKDDEILLHGFFEREGKRKTDYTTHIPIAKVRRKEMEARYER